MSQSPTANALLGETSPYLLQHANNPVSWYPWSEAALDKARREDKPILLSIGYSACHWCHVMAHESFENSETAAIMNRHFINIKVDREERPDLDKIYQLAQQLLTQRSGGWPLTMILTPDDHVPFFGGTYFPPSSRYGLPGFNEILQRVAEFYQTERDAIRQQNRSLMEAIQQTQTTPASDDNTELNPKPLFDSTQALIQSADNHYGGFSSAPKFPQPANIERLLHQHALPEADQQALQTGLFTLEKMALGGIYDHLAGGFCRYSVDDKWLIPHFEKMLYDNGPLLALYSDAWHISGKALFKKIAIETADWLMREMQSAQGGYYSSMDADSEGEEGKFYVWTPELVRTLLTAREYQLLAPHMGLDQPANFEGHWHLHISKSLPEIAEALSLDVNEAEQIINSARHKLYVQRKGRIWPNRDEKILTSWNGLAIKGMAIAAIRFDRDDYLASAERSLSFIYDKLWQDGRLLATYKDGKSHVNAYLDDYAFMLDAVLHLLAARWSSDWLDFAIQLAECLLEMFHDKENGGFFFTSHDHEQLIQRRKDFMDDAIPAGNGMAATALLALGHLINEPRYIEASEQCLTAAWHAVKRLPHAHNALLLALENVCFPAQQIILRGPQDSLNAWYRQCQQLIDIRTQVFAIPENTTGLPDILNQRPAKGRTTAYICMGFQCHEPITDLQTLTDSLIKSKAG